MKSVFIVPTGIGAEIGGHAGDATPALRLIASVCDEVVTHPNVVNASDINEMPPNALYVEGSLLDMFLKGSIELERSTGNHILLMLNDPPAPETMNMVSVARAVLGAHIEVGVLNVPLTMRGWVEDDVATGNVGGWRELCRQVGGLRFDALAIASEIQVPIDVAKDYYRNGGVNPWGGIEAITSKLIAQELLRPVAHAPVESASTKGDKELLDIAYNELVDPRMAAEAVSMCYVFCVLKGLHSAPLVGRGLNVQEIDCLISPDCWGIPHTLCVTKRIPVIIVRENKTVYPLVKKRPGMIEVQNYHEACGVVAGLGAGVSKESVRRPLEKLVNPNQGGSK